MDAFETWVETHFAWAQRGHFQTLKFLAMVLIIMAAFTGGIWVIAVILEFLFNTLLGHVN